MKCRHRTSWILGSSYEWCYRCGAFRRLRATGLTSMVPVTTWCRPTGPNGDNPFGPWAKRNAEAPR
jgi:hypothetical protein